MCFWESKGTVGQSRQGPPSLSPSTNSRLSVNAFLPKPWRRGSRHTSPSYLGKLRSLRAGDARSLSLCHVSILHASRDTHQKIVHQPVEVYVDAIHFDPSNLLVLHSRSSLCFHSRHESPRSTCNSTNYNNNSASLPSLHILHMRQRTNNTPNEINTKFLESALTILPMKLKSRLSTTQQTHKTIYSTPFK